MTPTVLVLVACTAARAPGSSTPMTGSGNSFLIASRLTADVALTGDEVMERRYEPVALSIQDRVQSIVSSHWEATSPPTGTSQQAYEIAAEAFAVELEELRRLVKADLRKLEMALEAAGGPWTPGRVPVWRK